MIDYGVVEDNDHIDLENLFDGIPDNLGGLLDELGSGCWSNPSPDSASFSIEDVEQFLMSDDRLPEVDTRPDQDAFFSDLLLDSPVESGQSGEPESKRSSGPSSPEEQEPDKEKPCQEKDEAKDDVARNEALDDENGPIAKKRKRQLRNRDAAVRSRERKKMYVRDLELKSKYYEAECRRLGMLLQCCIAENQSLHLTLQNSKAFDASMTKQESAVLLLELLLLGSLLGFLGIICLLTLPSQLQTNLEVVVLESSIKEDHGKMAPKRAASKVFKSFMMSKRCKASRSRMKAVRCCFEQTQLVM